jgi:hypothetical protein
MRKFWLATIVVVPLAVIFSACSSNGGGTAPSAGGGSSAGSVSSAAPPTTAPPAPANGAFLPSKPAASAPAATGGSSSTGGEASASSSVLAKYQPSTVVSESGGHTQLTSPDDVSKLTAFYQSALQQGGWSISSTAKTASSANFVAHKTGEGVTVAISTMGPSGTSVSISTYHQ